MMTFPRHSYVHPIDRLTSKTCSCLTIIMITLLVTQISAIELCSSKTCSDPNAHCVGNLLRYCKCNVGYFTHLNSGLCLKPKIIGESCSNSDQCQLFDEYSTCDHSTRTCVCKFGSIPFGSLCSLPPSSTTPSTIYLPRINSGYERIVVTKTETHSSFTASHIFLILSITIVIYLIKRTCNHCCRELPVNSENNSNFNSISTSPPHQLPRSADEILFNSRIGNNLNNNITPSELERCANQIFSNESNLIASGEDKPPSYEEAVNHQ